MSSVRIKSNCGPLVRNIFNEMWSAVKVHPDGGFPYPDFLVHDDYLPLLLPLFEMDKTLTPQEQAGIISEGFTTLRRANTKDFATFVNILNTKVSAIMAMPEVTFYLTTTISYRRNTVNQTFTKHVNRSTISICRQYPRKLVAKEWHSSLGTVRQGEPNSYACLYARIKARTRSQAASAMFADVELLLACLNLAYEIGRTVFSTASAKPFNTVRLGKFHQVHIGDGSVDKSTVWYDLEYQEEKNLRSFAEHEVKLRKHVAYFFSCLERSKLRDITEVGLRQYHGALNMLDRQLCLTRLWAALEKLMQSEANSETTAKRASFFSRMQEYRKDRLIHIARMRNNYVHAGTEISLVDNLVDDLRAYVAQIIRAMVFSELRCMSKDDFIQMLNLPADPKLMKEKIAIVRMGLKVRR